MSFFMILLCSLFLCGANIIVSYDGDSQISVNNLDTCLLEYTINYNFNDATYTCDYATIQMSRPTDASLRADIILNGSFDNYSFMFFDNGDDELYIYTIFKYLTIYKNDTMIGTTYVSDDNITIFAPNASYIIDQSMYAHCPLPTFRSYYCQDIDNSTIPENVMAAGIAVTLTSNYPFSYPSFNSKTALIVTGVIACIFVVSCIGLCFFTRTELKSVRNRNQIQTDTRERLLEKN